MKKLLLLVFVYLFDSVFSSQAHAAILFEGWSKVLLSGQHKGYAVQRYEFDDKKKEFRATSYMKINTDGDKGLVESLVARADASLKPIAYQYTGMNDGKPITIDGTVKAGKLTAKVVEGKEKKTVVNTLKEKTIFTTFLSYAMLQGKEGLKKGVKYGYSGIMEESAAVVDGSAYISEEETVSGIPVFRVLNELSGSKFVSLASHKGEVLGTTSPTINVQTILVATKEEAVGTLGLNNSTLSALFGSVPTGKENEIARRAAMPAAPAKAAPAASPALAPSTNPAPTPKAGK